MSSPKRVTLDLDVEAGAAYDTLNEPKRENIAEGHLPMQLKIGQTMARMGEPRDLASFLSIGLGRPDP